MKKIYISYLNIYMMIGWLCIMAISCSDSKNEVPAPAPKPEPVTLTISPKTLPVVDCKGDKIEVEVNCNGSWSVSSEKNWCTVSPSSGSSGKKTVTLTVLENTEYDERNTAITFKSGIVTEKMTLTQKQKDALLLDSSEKEEVGASGGNIQIKLRANIAYSYAIEEGVDWIHEQSKSVSRGLKEGVIELEVDENSDVKTRQAVIVITAGDHEEKVTVYQNAGEPQLILSQTDYMVSSSGETICVQLRSNSEYSYELSDVDWIKESESRAMSSYTHYFEVLPNETYDKREAQIKFVNKENGDEQFVSIKQVQLNAIVVAQDKYRINSEAKSWDLTINTNVEFEAVSSASWLKVNRENSRGLVEEKISISAEANISTSAREATITLTGEGLVQTIHVVQIGKTDRIKLVIQHEEKTLLTPAMEGENAFGTTDWGDGNNENYARGRAYTYQTEGRKKATFDVYGAKSFTIDKIGSISSLTIYVDKGKSGSVEDVEIDQKEWD